MAMPKASSKYFLCSVMVHGLVLLLLFLGFDHASIPPVFENTNQHDIVSAVILGDTAKSKILPQKVLLPSVQQSTKKEAKKAIKLMQKQVKSSIKPIANPSQIKQPVSLIKENTIALKQQPIEKKPIDKKKLAEEKLLNTLKSKDIFGKNLLADIQKQKHKQNKLQQKRLQSQFQKLLREQSEQSLRQQLLNEEIKLQGTQTKQSQGEVNKYKALILQAISEHWLVPNQANKQLSCELMIRVAPGGMVIDVQITKTSGDPSLDNSARAAVLKASPLPVPTDSEAFAPFRQFVLKVKPENILRAAMSL